MKQEAAFILQNGAIYDPQNRSRFFKGTTISQNISLEDAPSFFQSLSDKGINLLLWQITWDSIEPEEPEKYDEEYLAQLRLVLKYAEDYDISIIMQPVMKGWNKLAGGVGAPDWTLKTIGIDSEKLSKSIETAQNFIQENKLPKTTENPIIKYVKDTMFTLFWAGKDFAPDLLIEGDNIQDYLQTKYIDAMKHTARRIKDCKSVIGFSCMNGAEKGFVDLATLLGKEENPITIKIKADYGLSSFEAIKAANGYKAEFVKQGTNLPLLKQTGNLTLALEENIFMEGKQCPWKNSLWSLDENQNILLNKDKYFCSTNENSFAQKYYKTFQQDFVAGFQKKRGHYIFLSEPANGNEKVQWIVGEFDSDRNSMVEKEGGVLPDFDIEAAKIIAAYNIPKVAKTITGQIDIKDFEKKFDSEMNLAKKIGIPVLGIMSEQLNANLNDFYENHFESYVFKDTDFVSPYPIAINGKLQKIKIEHNTNPSFEMQWESVPVSAEADPENATEIFIPKELFPDGWKVELFEGVGTVACEPEKNRLYITTLTAQKCTVKVVSD